MKKINFVLAVLVLPLVQSMWIQADYKYTSIMNNFSGKDSTSVQIFNAQDQVIGEINTPTAGVKGMKQGTSKEFKHDDIAKFVVYDVNNGVLDTSHPYVTLASEIKDVALAYNNTINANEAFVIGPDKKVKKVPRVNTIDEKCLKQGIISEDRPWAEISDQACSEQCRNRGYKHSYSDKYEGAGGWDWACHCCD